MRKILLVALGLLLLPAFSRADSITFKNGETLTGTWEQVEGGKIVFKSDNVGEITVAATKLESISVSTAAVAILKDGTTVSGDLQLDSKGALGLVPSTKPGAAPETDFVIIYPAATFKKFEQTENARLWQDWNGSANLGYNLQSGDQQARNFSSTINATRNQPDIPGLSPKWRSTYFLTSLFANAKDTLTGATVNSSTLSTGLRQDWLFSGSNFLFAFGQFDYVQPQGISNRETLGGGYGRDLIHTSKLVFSLMGGMTYVNTNFIGTASPAEQSAEALVGEKISAQPTKWLHLDHYLNFYPNLTQTGQYRFDTSTTLSIPVRKKLSFQVSYIDFYLSNPALGSHMNNSTFSTGLGYSF